MSLSWGRPCAGFSNGAPFGQSPCSCQRVDEEGVPVGVLAAVRLEVDHAPRPKVRRVVHLGAPGPGGVGVCPGLHLLVLAEPLVTEGQVDASVAIPGEVELYRNLKNLKS